MDDSVQTHFVVDRVLVSGQHTHFYTSVLAYTGDVRNPELIYIGGYFSGVDGLFV